MGGLEHLRAWLRAELFLTNFRPVPLSEHAVFRGKVYEKIAKEVCWRPGGPCCRSYADGLISTHSHLEELMVLLLQRQRVT